MTSTDDVVPERFHPTTIEAGIPQVELPCHDPVCKAAPGEACSGHCSSGEVPSAPDHGDLVALEDGTFAVRHCPRCTGTGRDTASPDREGCRCRVDALGEMEMRATALYEQTQHQDEPHALEEVHSLDAEALVIALGEVNIPARMHLADLPAVSVVIDTRFGRVEIDIDRVSDRVLVFREVDFTQWTFRVPGESRAIARTLRDSVPELARDGDRLTWVIAHLPSGSHTVEHWFILQELTAGQPCPYCEFADECPGPRGHLGDYLKLYREANPTATLVAGAFPMPGDAPADEAEAAAAIDEAITPVARMIARRALVIT